MSSNFNNLCLAITNAPNVLPAGDAFAVVAIESTDRGFLPPRMTTAQRLALSAGFPVLVGVQGAAQASMLVYDTDLNAYYYWDPTVVNMGPPTGNWVLLSAGSGGGSNIWEWATYLVSPDFTQFNAFATPPPIYTYTDIQTAIDDANADYVAAANGRRRLVLVRPGVYTAAGGVIELKQGVDLMGAENSLTANDATSLTKLLPVQIQGQLQLNITGASSDPPSLVSNMSWVAPAGTNALVTLATHTTALNCTNCTFSGDTGPTIAPTVSLTGSPGASFQNCIFYTDNAITASYSLESFAGNAVTLLNCQLNRGAVFRADATIISTLFSCTALNSFQNYGPGTVSVQSCELHQLHLENVPPSGLNTTLSHCTVYGSQITGNANFNVDDSTLQSCRSFVLPATSVTQFNNCNLVFDDTFSIQVTDASLQLQNTVCKFEDSDRCLEMLRSNVTVDNSVLSFLSDQVPVSLKSLIFVGYDASIASNLFINNSKLSFFLENTTGNNYCIYSDFVNPFPSTSIPILKSTSTLFLRGTTAFYTAGEMYLNECSWKEAGFQLFSETACKLKNSNVEKFSQVYSFNGRVEISNCSFQEPFEINNAAVSNVATPQTIVSCCHFTGGYVQSTFTPDPIDGSAVQKNFLTNCSISGYFQISCASGIATTSNCLVRLCNCSIGYEQTSGTPIIIANSNDTDNLCTLETFGNSIFSPTDSIAIISAPFSTVTNSTMVWKSQNNCFFGLPFDNTTIVAPNNTGSGVQ